MADIDSRKGSGVLYNPYLDRSRASSVGSIRDKTFVEKEEYSDDSEELAKPAPKVEAKKTASQAKSPLITAEGKQKRGGFFSNMKQILEMKKASHQSFSRGVSPTRSGDVSVRSINVSMSRGVKTGSNTETSITAGKISLAQFMDNLATQKKINTSMLAARKLSSQIKVAPPPDSSIKVTPGVPKGLAGASKDKPFTSGFAMNLKIKKDEFSNLANDLSSSEL